MCRATLNRINQDIDIRVAAFDGNPVAVHHVEIDVVVVVQPLFTFAFGAGVQEIRRQHQPFGLHDTGGTPVAQTAGAVAEGDGSVAVKIALLDAEFGVGQACRIGGLEAGLEFVGRRVQACGQQYGNCEAGVQAGLYPSVAAWFQQLPANAQMLRQNQQAGCCSGDDKKQNEGCVVQIPGPDIPAGEAGVIEILDACTQQQEKQGSAVGLQATAQKMARQFDQDDRAPEQQRQQFRTQGKQRQATHQVVVENAEIAEAAGVQCLGKAADRYRGAEPVLVQRGVDGAGNNQRCQHVGESHQVGRLQAAPVAEEIKQKIGRHDGGSVQPHQKCKCKYQPQLGGPFQQVIRSCQSPQQVNDEKRCQYGFQTLRINRIELQDDEGHEQGEVKRPGIVLADQFRRHPDRVQRQELRQCNAGPEKNRFVRPCHLGQQGEQK